MPGVVLKTVAVMNRIAVQSSIFLSAVLALAVLADCNGEDRRIQLLSLKLGMQLYADVHKRGPGKLEDLDHYFTQMRNPALRKAIEDGEIVVVWEAKLHPYDSDPDVIVAYEKDAVTRGGWVITKKGDRRQVTAEEFKSLKMVETLLPR